MQIIKEDIIFNVRPNFIKEGEDPWLGGTEAFWKEFQSSREEDTKVIKRFVKNNHSYLDIGAWVGSTTLFAANLVKKCYAFEPDPVAFSFLKRNVAANPELTNIELYQLAVGSLTGKMKFGTKTGQGDSMSSTLWSDNSWEIDSISLEDIFDKYNITDCNFIKMDIEGGEFETLPAAKEILKQIKPILYLSLHAPWFEDKKLFFEKIIDVLSIYNNIYNFAGKKLSLEDIKKLNGFITIIAANE